MTLDVRRCKGDAPGKPCIDYFMLKRDVTDEENVRYLSKKIFNCLDYYVKNKMPDITFRTNQKEFPEEKNPQLTFIYLKAIDKALRDCKEKLNAVPTVDISLNDAGVTDEMLPLLTKMIEDGLIGSGVAGMECNTSSRIYLNNNHLTPKSLLSFASAIKAANIRTVMLLGNTTDKETEDALIAWRGTSLPGYIPRSSQYGIVINQPKYFDID